MIFELGVYQFDHPTTDSIAFLDGVNYMQTIKICQLCGIAKSFSYFNYKNPNIKTSGDRGALTRSFNPEDLEDICKPCQERRNLRFDRADDIRDEDYIYELGANSIEFSDEDLEWAFRGEGEGVESTIQHSFSIPYRHEWFLCKGCTCAFPKELQYQRRNYCPPCGRAYNREHRKLSYKRTSKRTRGRGRPRRAKPDNIGS